MKYESVIRDCVCVNMCLCECWKFGDVREVVATSENVSISISSVDRLQQLVLSENYIISSSYHSISLHS